MAFSFRSISQLTTSTSQLSYTRNVTSVIGTCIVTFRTEASGKKDRAALSLARILVVFSAVQVYSRSQTFKLRSAATE